MATITATAENQKVGLGNPFILTRRVDFSVDTMAQNDIMPALNIDAGTLVMAVAWEVETVEGAARNFAIGDGSDDDGYITTTSANSATSGCSSLALTEAAPNTVTGYSNGKYYSAADTIDIKAVTAGGLTTAVMVVSALCVKLI